MNTYDEERGATEHLDPYRHSSRPPSPTHGTANVISSKESPHSPRLALYHTRKRCVEEGGS